MIHVFFIILHESFIYSNPQYLLLFICFPYSLLLLIDFAIHYAIIDLYTHHIHHCSYWVGHMIYILAFAVYNYYIFLIEQVSILFYSYFAAIYHLHNFDMSEVQVHSVFLLHSFQLFCVNLILLI